jgi:hypothetical protein
LGFRSASGQQSGRPLKGSSISPHLIIGTPIGAIALSLLAILFEEQKNRSFMDRLGFIENLSLESIYVLLKILGKPKPTRKAGFLVFFFIVWFWIAKIFI